MSLLSYHQLNDVIDLPISLPATRMLAGSALVVASTGILPERPAFVSARWLQLRVVSPTGVARLAVFKNYSPAEGPSENAAVDGVLMASGETACGSVLGSEAFKERNFLNVLRLTKVGVYSWVVWAESDCDVSVTGSVRLGSKVAASVSFGNLPRTISVGGDGGGSILSRENFGAPTVSS